MAGSPAGGAELFYERLTAALQGAGDSVLAVIRRDEGRAGRLHQAGVTPIELPFGGPLDFITGPRLGRALREFGPDVAVAWMNRAARFTPVGPWLLVGRLGGYYDLRYYRRCDHLVGNTIGIVAWIAAQGWPAHRVHHLPNFSADFGAAKPVSKTSLGVPEEAPLVLALGRLHANKAFDVLIRAMTLLPGLHAVIAGEGPERSALEALARQEGIADRVHLPGWRNDTGALLAAADVLACPSRIEPLGNVVLEAWSARRPVVAAAADGPMELIRDGQDGVLVPTEDASAFADGIRGVLEHRAYATALAAAGRARFEAGFAERPVLARWRDFLGNLKRETA